MNMPKDHLVTTVLQKNSMTLSGKILKIVLHHPRQQAVIKLIEKKEKVK